MIYPTAAPTSATPAPPLPAGPVSQAGSSQSRWSNNLRPERQEESQKSTSKFDDKDCDCLKHFNKNE